MQTQRISNVRIFHGWILKLSLLPERETSPTFLPVRLVSAAPATGTFSCTVAAAACSLGNEFHGDPPTLNVGPFDHQGAGQLSHVFLGQKHFQGE
jgi:hypothetical protein